jgi:uncharacterized integral membrane protein (TIGR00697 family)
MQTAFASQKKTNLYIILCSIFLCNAIVAEIIGAKIFSLETLLGTAPAQLNLGLDFKLDFNLTAGVIIWPLVFVTSDVINEYFGKEGVKRISFITAALIAYIFVVILAVTKLPPADFWMQLNAKGPNGEPFDINYAFNSIFLQGLGIMLGSITAFLVGQLLDAYTFHWIRSMTGSKKIWLRATGSTLVSQLVDSFVVLVVAFYLFGNWSFKQVIAVGIINYIYKFGIAIATTPLLYVMHFVIDRYLGTNKAESMAEKSAQESQFE